MDYENNYIVGYAGTIVIYAGGKITAGGVVLEPLGTLGGNHDAWVHDNKDGISIYASPWQTKPEEFDQTALDNVGGLGFFAFTLSKYRQKLSRQSEHYD